MLKRSNVWVIVMSMLIVLGLAPLAVMAQAPANVAPEAVNPLNVPDNTNAEGVFFQGGYGIDYIKNAADIFAKIHPSSTVSVEGIQGVGEKLRPRFIAGNPPDVIDNSGANNLDTAALANEGLLLDLAPLMNAPALDTPGKTFAETLFPNSQANGVYNGKQFALNMAYTVFSVWYNKNLFAEKGWTYPTTWEEMLALCEQIKSAGIAPWIYQGQYPEYMGFGLFEGMVYKLGGDAAWKAVDNLEPNAWRNEAIVKAVTQMAELYSKGYIMKGTEALNHTESQTEWLKGKAAFIPCGTWLENEMKGVIPDGFEMVTGGSPGPGNAAVAEGGEIYFVPAKAKNPAAGMEYLRCLFSKASAGFFAEKVSSIMAVQGGTEGVQVSPGMTSAMAVVAAAGKDVYPRPLFLTWYNDLKVEYSNSIGSLLTGKINPQEFIDRVQAKADEIAADKEIPKFKR